MRYLLINNERTFCYDIIDLVMKLFRRGNDMRYIGIRVTPNDIYYSIIEGKENSFNVISISNIKIPKALKVPERLSYIRNLLITIIEQYSIQYAAIRVIEGSAMGNVNGSILFRVNLEGVVQEVFADSTI